MKKVTMEEIARQLGISKGLVSLALSNKYGVNEETKSQIIHTALKMGYDFGRVNKVKKKAKAKSITLFLYRGELDIETFWTEIIMGIEEAAYSLDYKITIQFWSTEDKEADILEGILMTNVNGIIALNAFPVDVIKKMKGFNIPFVLIDGRKYFGSEIDHLRVNNYDGGYKIAEYIVKNGHKDIIFLGDKNFAISFMERYRGFKDFIAKCKGVRCRFITEKSDDSRYDTFNYTKFQEQLLDPPTVIMCINDWTAIHVYEILKRKNIRIPEDISVVSFDNSRSSDTLHPKLTGIDFYIKNMGKEAVKMLHERITSGTEYNKTVLMPTRIIEKESFKPLNNK